MKLNKLSSVVGGVLLVAAAAFSSSAFADSAIGAGGAPNTAQARLDFTITIPKVLQFRVGTAAAGTIDAITFTPTAAVIGNSTPVAGAGGDLAGGAVTAKVTANSGQVTINAATGGALSDAAVPTPHTIPWSQVTTTAAVLTSATALAAPVIPLTGTGANVNAPVPVAGVTVADAKWTYAYANTTVPAAGIYGGTVAKFGRVTYTASAP